MYCNLFDSHVHSDNSFDGESPITYICEKAVEYGLSGVAITDHCDVNVYVEDQVQTRMRQSGFEILVAKDVFRSRLILSKGIELGQPLEALPQTEIELVRAPYDFVLASLHNLPGMADFCRINFDEEDYRPLLAQYYQEMLRMVQWNRFDSLAHLEYPLRYIEGVYHLHPDPSAHEEILREILAQLAANGKALELNTAGLRQPIGRTTPTLQQLKLFRELGGVYVTLGSDAHRAEDVGKGLDKAMELLEAAGFRYFAFYHHHEPCMLKVL